jgi:multiple sugar transport system permease protein
MSDAVLQIAGIVPPQEVPAPQGLRPAAHRSDRARIAAAYALSAPALLLMLVLVIAPLFTVVVLAFTDYQLGERTLRFVGLANFRTLASAAVFWKALGNTAVYVLVVVPGSVALGLAAAMLIEGGTRLKAFYRTVMFLPIMATLIAMAIVWEFMLHPTFGLVNLALEAVGLRGRNWLQDGDTALYVLAVIGIWQQFGFNMVLFLAGLLSIPRHLYEAAAIDGARSGWDRFCLVTWPMLGPITLFVAVISTIRAFQIFDTVQALTRGGPNKATEVLLYSMYPEAFEFFRTGYAAAIAVVFIVLVTMLTLIKTNLLERRVHY